MKNGLYYHPERIKSDRSPLIMNSTHHHSITYFVRTLEKIAPECTEELERLSTAYEEAYKWYVENGFKVSKEPSYWAIVKNSNQNEKYKGYRSLREGLLSWAQTFHLTGFNDFYYELALWAIADYYESCLDIERKKRLKEAKEFCQKIGRSEEEYWNVMNTTKPYHERLSLSESICFEEELDTHELEETRHPIVHGFFDANTPFVFAPNRLNTVFDDFSTRLYDFENILEYDRKKTRVIKKVMSGDDLGDYEPMDWFFGQGWDPRNESWRDFEKKIDDWFLAYKKMYKQRAERFLVEKGYTKAKDKRNLEHFEWLVRYQIQNWTLKEIADYYSIQNDTVVNEDTVWKAVKNTSEIVLLTLREPNKAGRPRNK
ncbi:hypothetical protein RB298_04685 [Priestia sp. BR_2]